jgi:hypothetical protein
VARSETGAKAKSKRHIKSPSVLGRVGVDICIESSDGRIDSGALHLAAISTGGIMQGRVTMEPHFPGKFPQLGDGLAGPDGSMVKR